MGSNQFVPTSSETGTELVLRIHMPTHIHVGLRVGISIHVHEHIQYTVEKRKFPVGNEDESYGKLLGERPACAVSSSRHPVVGYPEPPMTLLLSSTGSNARSFMTLHECVISHETAN